MGIDVKILAKVEVNDIYPYINQVISLMKTIKIGQGWLSSGTSVMIVPRHLLQFLCQEMSLQRSDSKVSQGTDAKLTVSVVSLLEFQSSWKMSATFDFFQLLWTSSDLCSASKKTEQSFKDNCLGTKAWETLLVKSQMRRLDTKHQSLLFLLCLNHQANLTTDIDFLSSAS